MDSAAVLAVENKVKDYNDRAKELFQKSVKQALHHNTDAIINLFAPFSSIGGGLVVLQPVASTRRDTRVSSVSFPAQSMPGKRIKLVSFSADTQTCSTYVPTLNNEEADKLRDTSGATAYPDIKTLANTEYYVIAGHLSSLPVELQVMIHALQKTPVVMAEIITDEPGNPIVMPMLLTAGAIAAIYGVPDDSEYAVPLDTDRVLGIIRTTARERQTAYLADVQTAIHRLQVLTNGGRPAAAGGNQDNWDTRKDALLFLLHCRQSAGNYTLFYKRYSNLDADADDPDPLKWYPRRDRRAQNAYETTSIERRCYTAHDLATFTTPEHPIAAVPAKVDAADDAPVPVITSMYRFQTQTQHNQTRFRLNYVLHSGMGPALTGGQLRDGDDDIGDRHGFDSDMKRFEFDLKVRNHEGYCDEIRTFLRVLLQTVFSKTTRPDVDKLPVVGTVDLDRAKKNDGFLFIPSVSTQIHTDPQYQSTLRVPVMATSPAEFYRSYPTWTSEDAPVSSAALFLWRHAVSRNTTPFSATADTSNLSDVATILSTIDPFPVYSKQDVDVCTAIQHEIQAKVLPMFKETPGADKRATMLHLIQLTGSKIKPGNTNFAQPFTPLSVSFPDTAIRKSSTSNKYRLEYTIGCQATVLTEAISIASALLRVLYLNVVLTDSVPAPPDEFEDDDTDIPETHMVPETLPLFQSDKEYKEHAISSTNTRSGIYGLTNSFTSAQHPDGRVILTDYYAFYGLDTDISRNKAARIVLGQSTTSLNRGGNPIPRTPPTSAPGVYNDRSDLFDMFESSGMTTYEAQPLFKTVVLRLHNPERGLQSLVESRTVYDDYILHDFFTTHTLGVSEYRIPNNDMDAYTPDKIMADGVHGPKAILTSTTGGITLPVYRVDAPSHLDSYDERGYGNTHPELVAFVTFDELVLDIVHSAQYTSSSIQLLPHDQLDSLLERTTPRVLTVRSVVDSTLVRRVNPGQATTLHFNTYATGKHSYKYYIGLNISAEYLANFTLCRPKHQLSDPTVPNVEWATSRFLPFVDVTNASLLTVSNTTWDRNMSAYTSDWQVPRPIDYTKSMFGVSPTEISFQLGGGLQGFHFSRADDAGRTTFAVAVNRMAAAITTWYTAPENARVYNEPRGINLMNPDHCNDAMLVRLVQEGEAQGNSLTYATSNTRLDAVSMDALITPVIVIVRGPGANALSTPCYIEHVYAKTSAYRFVESKLLSLLYNRMGEHPRQLPKNHSPRCLGIMLRRRQDAGKTPYRTLRVIVTYDKRFVAPVAALVLQIRDFEKIPRRTDKSRNTNAIVVAQREMLQGVYDLLYLI
jgi:hypothetical protein